jgi:taurine dioxygenase
MDIRPSNDADATQLHPLLSPHPDTGEERLYGCIGYLIGVEGMPDDEAMDLLMQLHAHQTQEKFVYAQKWEPGQLVVWDNRSVLHRATGGYEGHNRLLHRTTVGELSLSN